MLHINEWVLGLLHRFFSSLVQVAWGSDYRAHLTVPPEVELSSSLIPGARLGIKATTFIRAYTWLAEYECEIVLHNQNFSPYAWFVRVSDARVYSL